MPEKGWKRAERMIAEMLHGKRIPVSGRQRGDSADIDHPDLSIEVKHWAKIPGWKFYEDAMDQAMKSIKDNEVAIVVVHKKGTAYGDSMVMLSLNDFSERFLDETGRLKTKWTQMDSAIHIPRIEDTADLFEGLSEGEL